MSEASSAPELPTVKVIIKEYKWKLYNYTTSYRHTRATTQIVLKKTIHCEREQSGSFVYSHTVNPALSFMETILFGTDCMDHRQEQ